MIHILSGDIRTGKTTALFDWVADRNDVDGVLCPDDENGQRYFLNIKSKKTYPLAANSDTEDHSIISIGPFRFLKAAFEEANTLLLLRFSEKAHRYLIIDELGKLELKNLGLHRAAETLIPDYMFDNTQHLILVVRASLLEDIIEHYNISAYSVLIKEDLKRLQ